MSSGTSSTFIKCLNLENNTKTGINGSDVYTAQGVEDSRVALYNILNGNEINDKIKNCIRLCVSDVNNSVVNSQFYQDLFVLIFQTRDIRGGKGLRLLSYHLFFEVYDNVDKDLSLNLLHLFPFYGYYKDLINIYNLSNERTLVSNNEVGRYTQIKTKILSIVAEQFLLDLQKLRENNNNISLLAKWLPREGSKNHIFYLDLVNYLKSVNQEFNVKHPSVPYRKCVSYINKHLNTVEINMCARDWASIIPSQIPGICMNKYRKAFLNLNLKDNTQRYSCEDRIKCANNIKAMLENKPQSIKGGETLYPHTLVSQISKNSMKPEEISLLNCQWNSIRDTFSNSFLKRCIPMCDLSGSMSQRLSNNASNTDTLMHVSIALSILISEINEKSFKDTIISFSSDAKVINLKGYTTLYEKVKHINSDMSYVGYSTNFERAFMKVLDTLVENKVPIGEEPEMLIVLTDMGFDQCETNVMDYKGNKGNSFRTVSEILVDRFRNKCIEVHGENNETWKLPKIVIWNLSSQYDDFQAKYDNSDIITISGWSKSVLKYLQREDFRLNNSYDILRNILDDERYDIIRTIMSEKTI